MATARLFVTTIPLYQRLVINHYMYREFLEGYSYNILYISIFISHFPVHCHFVNVCSLLTIHVELEAQLTGDLLRRSTVLGCYICVVVVDFRWACGSSLHGAW